MCECIVQPALTTDFLGFHGQDNNRNLRGDLNDLLAQGTRGSQGASSPRRNMIKPNMHVNAIRNRDGQLESVRVRWGWLPVWTTGVMPPRTVLPLHLVMRSRVFDRVRREGRVLIAVDGWYEAPSFSATSQWPHLNYTTAREASPIFLAAIAQISDKPCGCDGLVLLTHGGKAGHQPRLLAFSGEDALDWLSPDLPWEQAERLAEHKAVAEPQLEHVLTSQRPHTRRRGPSSGSPA